MTDDWVNQDGHELPEGFFEDLPQPLYWRILVLPRSAQERSKGGIYLAASSQEAQEHLCYIGQVLAVGPGAFKEARLCGDKVEIGSWVVYGRYAGQRLEYKKNGLSVKLLIVNDDEVLARAPNPDVLRVHV